MFTVSDGFHTGPQAAVTAPRDLPTGEVTFLFTDVEGSTNLLHELGAQGYADALAEHRAIVRDAFTSRDGVEVDTQGDAFFVAFTQAQKAVDAAAAMVEALEATPIRIRIGIHTGSPHVASEGYVGADVNKGARIAASGHGGQVLLSLETRERVEVDTTDLGEHRVKGFDSPVWIHQLGTQRFPPLKTISNTNLPRPTSPLVGRRREVEEVVAHLRDGARLLTLTGPGGTGKTRLSIEAAAEVISEFRNGVFWVELAPLADAALVTDANAHTIGAKEGLAEHISDNDMLLLLDNFEQVVNASPQLSKLLMSCPNLKLMVTSRELLRVSGEVEYPVPPLREMEAVELFSARSGLEAAVGVAELCRRLDHLPLAVELAAARTQVLTPAKILERLAKRLDLLKGGRDADPRQATLRATIDWSYDLLDEAEKRLFACLSVFRGGSTLEAAEAVCGADLDVLQSLVDKSLVRRSGERFWMLETIREFALERLDDSDESNEIRRRHAEHFLALVERAYDDRITSGSEWFPTIRSEHDNFRAALDWAAATDRTETEARLAGAVAHFWSALGYAAEATNRLLQGAERYTSRNAIAARILTELGGLLGNGRNPRDGLTYLYEALDLWREQGQVTEEAETLEWIGYCHVFLEELEEARQVLETSLELRRQVGPPELEGGALSGLCLVLVASGDVEPVEPMAQDLVDRSTPLESTNHHARLTAHSGYHLLADCALVRGDHAEAERRYRRAFEHARQWQLLGEAAIELVGLAMAMAGRGHHERALRLASAAYQQLEDLGFFPTGVVFWDRLQERFIGGARLALGETKAAEVEASGRSVPFDDVAREMLHSLEGPAPVHS